MARRCRKAAARSVESPHERVFIRRLVCARRDDARGMWCRPGRRERGPDGMRLERDHDQRRPFRIGHAHVGRRVPRSQASVLRRWPSDGMHSERSSCGDRGCVGRPRARDVRCERGAHHGAYRWTNVLGTARAFPRRCPPARVRRCSVERPSTVFFAVSGAAATLADRCRTGVMVDGEVVPLTLRRIVRTGDNRLYSSPSIPRFCDDWRRHAALSGVCAISNGV